MDRAFRAAMLMIDFINLFDYDDADALAPRAIKAARATARLKARARAARIPCIYANDNFGNWTSEFTALARETPTLSGNGRASSLTRKQALFNPETHWRGFMATRKRKTRSNSSTDAIKLLTADHNKVKKLFKAFEKIREDGDAGEKSTLVAQICTELTIHSTLEEEIFYPAVRDAIDESDIMDEAEVEHESARELIAQLSSMRPGEEHYDAKVTVLGEYIDHHVKEEQNEMFPKAKRAKVDTAELGRQIAERKEQLQSRSRTSGDTRNFQGSRAGV